MGGAVKERHFDGRLQIITGHLSVVQASGGSDRGLKALGRCISSIWLLNLNTAITEQVNGNSTT